MAKEFAEAKGNVSHDMFGTVPVAKEVTLNRKDIKYPLGQSNESHIVRLYRSACNSNLLDLETKDIAICFNSNTRNMNKIQLTYLNADKTSGILVTRENTVASFYGLCVGLQVPQHIMIEINNILLEELNQSVFEWRPQNKSDLEFLFKKLKNLLD